MKNLIATILSMGVVISAQAADYSDRNFIESTPEHFNASNPSDTRIAEEIRDQLGTGWFSRGFDTVRFNVTDGAVTLQGTVPTVEDKANLENTIKGLDGVRSFNSSLTVQGQVAPEEFKASAPELTASQLQKIYAQFPQDKFATPADKLLNAQIRNAVSIGYLWNSYDSIRLNTRDGAVILEGTIGNAKDQDKLINEIREIHGVQSVKSSLHFSK